MNVVQYQKVRDGVLVPRRASNGAVGYDIFASVVLNKQTKEVISELPVDIPPGGAVLVGTGVRFAVPWGWECQVRPRSGLANKFDIELSNAPGTIDPDFRGEAGVLLRNRGSKSFTVEKNMRIAQLIFSRVEIPVFEEADQLPSSLRGTGGFGSTGLFQISEGTSDYDRKIVEIDSFFMDITCRVAKRSRCVRGVPRDKSGKLLVDTESGEWINQTRKFGCVLVKDGNIVGMGFNAQCEGEESCEKVGCLRDGDNIPSGTMVEHCRALHAEWWALTNVLHTGGSVAGADLYVNSEPCHICSRLIINCGIATVIMKKGVYQNNGVSILKKAGVNVRYI